MTRITLFSLLLATAITSCNQKQASNSKEKTVVTILQSKDTVPIDELNAKSNLSSGTIAAALLNLEMQGLVCSLPGKIYRLS